MDNLKFLYKQNINVKVGKKHEWTCVIESTCLVTSLQLAHASQNMLKKGQQEKIFFCALNKGQLPTLLM